MINKVIFLFILTAILGVGSQREANAACEAGDYSCNGITSQDGGKNCCYKLITGVDENGNPTKHAEIYAENGADEVEIGFRAFDGKQLTSVNIPNVVTKIGSTAFNNNKLSSVELPDSVMSVGYDAFSSNPVKKIVLGDSITELSMGALRGYPEVIVVPDTLTTIYKQSLGWNPNVKIICKGSDESCAAMAERTDLENYVYYQDYIPSQGIVVDSVKDMVDSIDTADETQCNSAKYFWNGSECIREPVAENRVCDHESSGYVKVGDYCYSPELTYAKKHYTPAEANQWLKDEGNDIIITFKK